MLFAPRTGAVRWLRIVLAVVALVATHASVMQAAFVTTCARAVSSGEISVAGAQAPSASHAAASEVALHAAHFVANHTPVEQAVVPSCATSVGAPTAVVDAPGLATMWKAAVLPRALQARPTSIAPPPPFRPPRAI